METVRASAKSRGLGVTAEAIGDGLQIRGEAGFDDLVTWLATLQQDQGLRITRLEIQPKGTLVSVDLTCMAVTATP